MGDFAILQPAGNQYGFYKLVKLYSNLEDARKLLNTPIAANFIIVEIKHGELR